MKVLFRFILGLLAPFILVFGGGALVGLGVEYDSTTLVWMGGIAVVCGLLWGCWLLFLDESTSWWD